MASTFEQIYKIKSQKRLAQMNELEIGVQVAIPNHLMYKCGKDGTQ